MSAMLLALCMLLGGGAATAHAEETAQSAVAPAKPDNLWSELAEPLQTAQRLIKSRRYQAALQKLTEAEAFPNKTPAERFLIDRLSVIVAAAAGDMALAEKSFQAVIASGKLTPPEQSKMIQALAGLYYEARNYPQAIIWLSRYLKEGGDNPDIHSLLIQSYYHYGEFAKAT